MAFLCAEGHAQLQKHKGYPDKKPDLDVLPGFVTPPKGYGNVPFYWWNGEPLMKERLEQQLDILSASATDGFAVSYIHTNPQVDTLENKNGYGLFGMTEPGVPKVFSDEWWDIWNWFSGECGKRGMGVGLDDYTVGWVGNGYYPDELDTMSVFKGSKGGLTITVDTLQGGETYESDLPGEVLTIVAWPDKIELTDKVKNGKIRWTAPRGHEWYVYTITTQPGYVIHPEHGKKLLEVYFNRFESKMDEAGREGMNYFFQDELAYPINMLSWSDDFRDEFLKRKGYDILLYLPALIANIGNITPKIRLDYCEVLMDLSEERYYKPIYDWHADRGLLYGCDNLSRGTNPVAYIDYFRATAWFTAPGNDAPSRGSSFLQTKVSSSVAHLYKRPRTWLEAFHSMGWGSSGAWLTKQIDHHFIAGGNLVCMHGLYYSTHGGWWEWAPPDFHFRMPYWPHMKQWLKYTERMSYLLSQGAHVCDIALLYPTEPVQAYPGANPDGAFDVALKLSNSGFDYDFIDFRSLREAGIEGKTLRIADEQYKIIVLPDMKAIHYSSLLKILNFYRSGGIVLAMGDLPKASDNKGEGDPDVDRIVKELFGCTADELTERRNPAKQTNNAGGIGWYVPESLEKIIPDLITPDFLTEKGAGKVLHRRIGERDVYMVADVEKGTECFFRARGKVELWDANTGKTQPFPVLRQTNEGTWLPMNKTSSNSYLIVFSPGEAEIKRESDDPNRLSAEIPLNGEWTVELLPTLNNKWGDYRLPAFDGLIAAEARSFKYAPAISTDLNWTKPDFNDSSWNDEIYGYGPQVETKAEDNTDWQPVSFSWQYGVWNHPGSQGSHGLKGKVDDRFFILDKGKNQQFRTFVYAPDDMTYRIETQGATADYIRIDHKEAKEAIYLNRGWHPLEVAYSASEKADYQIRTGSTVDNRKRGFVLLYPSSTALPEKPALYANKVSSRWGEGGHLLFDPDGGKYNEWNFRFETAPGLEEMILTVYGNNLKMWFDGEEIKPENIQIIQNENNWKRYLITLQDKKERTGKVAFSVQSEKGYQGTSIIKEPVQLKTSSGRLSPGDWSKEGSLRYYSGGMFYRTECRLPEKITEKKVLLELGDVIATCEVKINNQPAGILISPPYQVDITQFVKEGENDIEVLVYSTLSNHYQTIPTPYKGDPKAGLIGPVRISILE
jgi:hypothetical protein